MTKYNQVQPQVTVDIREMSQQDLENEYGIEFITSTTVYDPQLDREFKSLHLWSLAVIAEDDEENYESGYSKMGGKTRHYED